MRKALLVVALVAGATTIGTVPASAGPVLCNGKVATFVGDDTDENFVDRVGRDDVIVMRGGNDIVNAGLGNDTICAGTGDDTVFGGLGADTFVAEPTPDGADRYLGAEDGFRDTVTYAARAGAVTITLAGTDTDGVRDDGAPGEGDDVVDVENAAGGGGGDTITGDPGGQHELIGNGGDDAITAVSNDELDGGPGDDRLYAALSTAVVYLYGGDGDDTLTGGPRSDSLYGQAGADALHGRNGTDILIGGSGRDLMRAGEGDDYVDGRDGSGGDSLSGEVGFDTCPADPGDVKNCER